MSPYLGEIRMFAGNFEPEGWAFCDGRLLSISLNDYLYNLIGTTYGGDGQETFALPDLRGRLPVHQGTGTLGTSYIIGETAGVESVTLSVNQIPVHTHAALASSSNATAVSAGGNVLAQTPTYTPYIGGITPAKALNSNTVAIAGANQPHENHQPFLCVHFIISLFGDFPSQT